jgi:GT2 family glycosyltransferase
MTTSISNLAKSVLRRFRAELLSLNLPRRKSYAQPPEEMEASKSFSVVLPVHDAPEVTARCLQSLEIYGQSAEIILVDDGSRKAETRSLLKAYASKHGWLLVTHEKARRHSRACEHGCSYVTRPYICLLNSDTVVTPRVWSGIEECFKSDPRVAAAGPASNHDTFQLASRRALYCGDYWSNDQIYGFASRFVARKEPRSSEDVQEINGFAFFVRKTVWEEFGGFHPDLPDYGNEIEICARIREKGYRIIFNRNSYVHHFGGQSIGKVMAEREMAAAQVAAQKLIDTLHPGHNMSNDRNDSSLAKR